ncbi:MAG: response regulator transcription factor [Myxococcaceae bacterium]
MTAKGLPLPAPPPVARILVVDDDEGLRRRVGLFLGQHDLECVEAANGEAALAQLARGHFDAVLLDVMMPGMSGLDVVKRVRETSDIPILMLTARDSELDRVAGLELGADDHLGKPLRARELLARLRAVLRRAGADKPLPTMAAGGLEVDLALRKARLDGRELELGGIEFDLLVAFMRNRGRVLPRSRLLADAGRGHGMVCERTVDVHVSRLRKKLGDDVRGSALIKTVHGVGYVFSA